MCPTKEEAQKDVNTGQEHGKDQKSKEDENGDENATQQHSPFPWHLGVFDAHCHPTDTMSSVSSLPAMKTRILTVMSTRSQDQSLVSNLAFHHGITSPSPYHWKNSERVIPCFGWHPWFSHQMYIPPNFSIADSMDIACRDEKLLEGEEKIKHYQSILQPHRPNPSDEDLAIFHALPDPTPFSLFLHQTRQYLQTHPYALIGEVGLDRSFRIPMPTFDHESTSRDPDLTPGGREGRRLSPFRVDLKHQKRILRLQLELAGEMGRAVSVHGVQAHGLVYEAVMELCKGHEREVVSKRERKRRAAGEATAASNSTSTPTNTSTTTTTTPPTPYPPRICLHSYSGTPSTIAQYLLPSIPTRIFFSFSTAINLSDCSPTDPTPDPFKAIISAIPDHMLLVESDLHTAGEEMDRRMEDIVRRICEVKEWGLEKGVRILGRNWRGFVFGSEGEDGG